MSTPIDNLKQKYRSAEEHLKAIEDALMKQFAIEDVHRQQVRTAVHEAYRVGHSTTTTDDWCNTW